jgi:hypothetical protein
MDTGFATRNSRDAGDGTSFWARGRLEQTNLLTQLAIARARLESDDALAWQQFVDALEDIEVTAAP